jgi:hypothetical protein
MSALMPFPGRRPRYVRQEIHSAAHPTTQIPPFRNAKQFWVQDTAVYLQTVATSILRPTVPHPIQFLAVSEALRSVNAIDR